MREVLFPDIYTEWPTMKDVKPSDVDTINAYVSYIKQGDLIKAGEALLELKNKVMYTSDWQERFDVCEEMLDYLNKQKPYTTYYVGGNKKQEWIESEGYKLWFDFYT